jgi:hypothetical protein
MTSHDHHLMILIEAAVLTGQLVSGRALWVRWQPVIRREENPGSYWFMMALQGAFLIALMKYGRSWGD